MSRYLRKFPKYPDIRRVRQVSSHFGNFWIWNSQNTWESGKFLGESQVGLFFNYRNSSEISQIPSHFWNLKIYHPQIPIGIWEIWGIPQIPGNLAISPNTWESGEFPKFLFSSKELFLSDHVFRGDQTSRISLK